MNYLRERQLAFHITTACTLNCKLCVNMMPLFKARGIAKHIPFEQVKQEIKSVFQIYDYIEDVTISGGEPLLHPDLLKITEYCMSFEEQFHSLRIFTNGTIMPEPQLLACIKKWGGKLQIVIDDYGPQLSKKVQDISTLFAQNRLPLRINTYWGEDQHCGGWVNYGSPEQFRNYSRAELERQYQNCHVAQYRCIGVFNGKMVNCCWAIFGHELGFMPFEHSEPDQQMINLLDTSIPLTKKKQIAASYGRIPLWACQYCNGFDPENSERFPAGEQQ